MSDFGAALRLLRAGWIMTREGVIAALPGEELPALPKFGWRVAKLFTRRKARRLGRSERLADAVTRLGPSYVKLGQFLATRPDVVGADISRDLAQLAGQDGDVSPVGSRRRDRGFAWPPDRRAVCQPG